MIMAKAKKRVATRKKSSKRGNAGAKLGRKMAAKHAKPKKAKSKVQRAGMSAKKRAAKTREQCRRVPEPQQFYSRTTCTINQELTK
jgi:hypothetical protein